MEGPERHLYYLVSAWLQSNVIQDTSIPAIVRGAGIKCNVNEIRGMTIRIGRILPECGFERYRAMIDGVLAYRYRRRHPTGSAPVLKQHDRPLIAADVADSRFPQPDPWRVQPSRRTVQPIQRERRRRMIDRKIVSIYFSAAELEQLRNRATAEGMPFATFLATVIGLAVPHCPPGSVKAAFEARVHGVDA